MRFTFTVDSMSYMNFSIFQIEHINEDINVSLGRASQTGLGKAIFI